MTNMTEGKEKPITATDFFRASDMCDWMERDAARHLAAEAAECLKVRNIRLRLDTASQERGGRMPRAEQRFDSMVIDRRILERLGQGSADKATILRDLSLRGDAITYALQRLVNRQHITATKHCRKIKTVANITYNRYHITQEGSGALNIAPEAQVAAPMPEVPETQSDAVGGLPRPARANLTAEVRKLTLYSREDARVFKISLADGVRP